ncbi:ADP-ribosylation factor-like protein 15a isoform X1 [Centropristis striata]|uniref:ADP-ribosylation factor-like protein 15a isoform X1 n=1 Tax=Centropristis striata TaxID=184440 RepID=UPI0027E0BD7D|nr:ADP-ribosylation factor-like protein 15a isoform X1 [Centropristis striata]
MDYLCFRALCCKGPPPPRPEYDVVCIGLTGAGKTSLLSRLCSEGSDGIVPTTGFSIKAVPFPNAILNVKELGGADNIKKYWSRYYQGSQGVVFVLDSASSDEDLEAARNELHSALQHPQLCTLPFLILANHQDRPAARTPNQKRQGTLATLVGFSPIKPLYLPMFFISSKDFDMGAPQQSILDKTLRELGLTNKLSPCPKKTNDSLGYMTL